MIKTATKLTGALCLASLVLLALPATAPAMDYWWNVSTGSWHIPANWNPTGPPTAADNAFIDNGGDCYTWMVVIPSALNLTIGHANPDNTLCNGSFLTVGNDLVLGDMTSGGGRLINMNMVTVGNQAIVGKAGKGYVENYEGFTVNGYMTVGESGTGSFRDLGITLVTHNLGLGREAGSQGYYLLEGGQLTAGVLQVGLSGYGELSIGSYGGTPSVTVTDYEFQIGYGNGGEGFVHHYAGTVSVANAPLVLGVEAGSYGHYQLYGSGPQLHTKNSDIGRMGDGVFFHQEGRHLVADTLTLGQDATGLGYYHMDGGYLEAKNIVVGDYGSGYFSQNGGDIWAKERLVVGQFKMGPAVPFGNYGMNGGTLSVGDLTKPGALVIGHASTGGFMHGGGAVTVLGEVIVGQTEAGLGNYYMNGGTLKVGDTFSHSLAGRLVVGDSGTGYFTQQGGQVEVYGIIVLGHEAGGHGDYHLIPCGDLKAQSLTVGLRGQGQFLQSGGTMQINDTLAVKDGNQVSGAGSFTQMGGSAVINNVKNWGQMAFDHSAGKPMSTSITTMTNHVPGQVEFKGTGPADAFATIGAMTNYGQVKVTNTTVTFGSYVEYGAYISDPAVTVIQSDLWVWLEGFLVGGAGDVWQIGNDFFNISLKNLSWNTREAMLVFFQGPSQDTKHNLSIPGLDLGPTPAGFVNNFAWGKLDLSGQELWLVGFPGHALYVGDIEGLVLSGLNIVNIYSMPGLNLYYDPLLNPELGGQTYFLSGGGYLAPAVPVPGSVWLLLTGVAGLAAARWRRW